MAKKRTVNGQLTDSKAVLARVGEEYPIGIDERPPATAGELVRYCRGQIKELETSAMIAEALGDQDAQALGRGVVIEALPALREIIQQRDPETGQPVNRASTRISAADTVIRAYQVAAGIAQKAEGIGQGGNTINIQIVQAAPAPREAVDAVFEER